MNKKPNTTHNRFCKSESSRMSGSNNLSYSHWKSNLSLIGSTSTAASTSNYQNFMKLTSSSIPGGVIHQTHSSQLSEEHLIPAHSTHSSHSMSRIIGSPASTSSLYSPGSNPSSTAGPSIPTSIPRAHQHNVPIIQTSSTFADQSHHLDVYSQIGMQRIGQMFKSNLMANNNNNNCNNRNAKNNRPNYENTVKMEQSMNNIKQLVESAIGIEAKQQIMHILEKISLLQPPERLLLYLRMPSSTSETDPLRQPQNPLGTRSEINFTINWVRSHLEMDPNVSIPKQDVYDEYVAYCGREDVKPLSTADFGKVMKQIFPSIRPRRLGTRGNSRYCYAAMRKTTKLECPQLPNLGGAQNDSYSHTSIVSSNENETDSIVELSNSWKIIKLWAENLLNVEFKGPNELADHITTNYMKGNSGTISTNSRVLLQKKLLQRKFKGRKKKSLSMSEEIIDDGKKRRKKKLKKSLSQTNSEPAGNGSPESISTTNEQSVPDEILHIKQEQTPNNPQIDRQSISQAMPINLTNEHGKIKSEIDSLVYNVTLNEPIEMQDFSAAVCKIELGDTTDIEQTVFCKKVRRAQEEKGLSISMASPKISHQSPETKSSTLSPASLLMRPPLCEVPTDLSVSGSDLNNATSSSNDDNSDSPNPNMLQVSNKRTASNAVGRSKKLRFNKHASVAGMNETKVDDIATDIIIPRERVVSICNMDKDALDDYLNEGGDSQEQEAELLQYFQTSGQDKANQNTVTDTIASTITATATICTDSNAIQTTNAYPLLENYQLHQNAPVASDNVVSINSQLANTMTHSNQVPRKQDQINELRQYLQQNLQQSPIIQNNNIKSADERSEASNSQLNSVHELQENWKDSAVVIHSASSSLTALSLPYQQVSHDHQTENTSINTATVTTSERKLLPTIAQVSLMRSVRPPPELISNQTQQSPNSRSKNCSFVPISPGPQSPRVISQHTPQLQTNIHTIQNKNTFLSPRRSPAVRKSGNKDLNSCLKSLQDPTTPTFDTKLKNEISASAPASPSITPHHFQFNSAVMNPYSNASTNSVISNSNQPQPHHQHQASCSISGICAALERSQSVPLHCQSPAFNTPISNTAYNSVCNSVAQTPVPSEYADFSEDNILDMLTESSSDIQIKREVKEMSNLMQTDCNRSNISRSVPSTPLPMYSFHMNPLSNFGNSLNSGVVLTSMPMIKNTTDNSKSVPTTPKIGNNTNTPFRYSPEHHRDFLINVNTIDAAKGNQFFPSPANSSSSSQSLRNAPQLQSVSSTQSNAQVLLTTNTQSIEDLPNYSDVNDPIIEGSHLMNNL